jgi:HAD superfamily hydrolase (TIGR01549 family)
VAVTGPPRAATVRAVLFDALGTLVRLEEPGPRLAASVRRRLGQEVAVDRCAAAMQAEMRHYAANCIRARDDVSLAELRLECAGVLADALDLGADAADLLPCLTDAVSFRAYSDVAPALDRLTGLGLRMGVVSNWDVALPGVLDRLGLGDRFEVVVHSAGAGVQKPDPAIFAVALTRLGLGADEVVHVGDDARTDVEGAHAAGLRAVLLDRRDGGAGAIASLAELPARILNLAVGEG